MSTFICNCCNQLVDSDYFPDFTYDEETDEWTCQKCNGNEEYDQSPGVVDFDRTYSVPLSIKRKLNI